MYTKQADFEADVRLGQITAFRGVVSTEQVRQRHAADYGAPEAGCDRASSMRTTMQPHQERHAH